MAKSKKQEEVVDTTQTEENTQETQTEQPQEEQMFPLSEVRELVDVKVQEATAIAIAETEARLANEYENKKLMEQKDPNRKLSMEDLDLYFDRLVREQRILTHERAKSIRWFLDHARVEL